MTDENAPIKIQLIDETGLGEQVRALERIVATPHESESERSAKLQQVRERNAKLRAVDEFLAPRSRGGNWKTHLESVRESPGGVRIRGFEKEEVGLREKYPPRVKPFDHALSQWEWKKRVARQMPQNTGEVL